MKYRLRRFGASVSFLLSGCLSLALLTSCSESETSAPPDTASPDTGAQDGQALDGLEPDAGPTDADDALGGDDLGDGVGVDDLGVGDTTAMDVLSDAEAHPDGDDGADTVDVEAWVQPPAPADDGIHAYAHACVAIEGFDGFAPPRVLAADGETYGFADTSDGARFRMQPSDLGTFLFYDTEAHYLTAAQDDDGVWSFPRAAELQSSLSLMDDTFVSPAEWILEESAADTTRYQLKHRQSGQYLALDGLADGPDGAAVVTLLPREECAEFPELTLDAVGTIEPHQWEDGAVYGIAEIHSHMLTNFGFGGGSIFHGAPVHRLGVEHALESCEPYHGEDGKSDIVGFFYDGTGLAFDLETLLPILSSGEVGEFNHETDGYPDFTAWPNARKSSTHQTMYYRWLQRAWMGGMRLVVQHATGNSVLCEFLTGLGSQDVRYDCNDMVGVDRAIAEARFMERYIDAQHGGPGKGWFRIVESPAQAREVINQGKLAVVLGIEISNIFDCFSTPHEGFPECTPEIVAEKLDHYWEQGVRVIFPVHKYDNAFSAGDGSSGIIELGNFVNSGHYSNFVEDCPGPYETYDHGEVTFGGLNMPRENYDDPPPVDTTGFTDNLLASLVPFIDQITAPPIKGEFCQKHGMTPLGENLMAMLMDRGMLIEIAHLPQRAVGRAYEILEAAGYPAFKTHGKTTDGRLYALGGMTGFHFGRCGNPDNPGSMAAQLTARVQEVVTQGGYPAQALAFDFNGFAHGPGPRFGPEANCNKTQENPVTYPFTSYDGQVTFQEPQLGSRSVDFNTEGMIHIGLLPELLEDVRRDGATDEDLEPLFRSAEAYLQLWEKVESMATVP